MNICPQVLENINSKMGELHSNKVMEREMQEYQSKLQDEGDTDDVCKLVLPTFPPFHLSDFQQNISD